MHSIDRKTRRTVGIALTILVLIGLGALAVRAWQGWTRQRGLDRAESAMRQGRYDEAIARLRALSRHAPDHPEIRYQLALASAQTGDTATALEALAAIPPTSDLRPQAALLLGPLALDAGALALAERYLLETYEQADLSDRQRGQIGLQLSTILQHQYRFDAVKRWLRRAVPHLDDPVTALQLHALGETAFANSEVEQRLLGLSKRRPDDQRIRLALARRALRQGELDEAQRQLAFCLQSKTNDHAVLQTQLEIAQARQDARAVRDLLEHLPADTLTTADLLRLKAWFAARIGEAEVERQAWSDLLDIAPTDARALSRLAELAAAEGDTEQARSLRDRKAKQDALLTRYRSQIRNPKLPEDASALAHTAEALGRPFEARAWHALAQERTFEFAEATDTLDPPVTRDSPDKNKTRADLIAWIDQSRMVSGQESDSRLEEKRTRPIFVDRAELSGLTFTFDYGASVIRQLPETMCGGLALLDFDRDGWLDVFVLQSGPVEPGRDDGPSTGDRLFRNQGDGTFLDVTESAGLPTAWQGVGNGVTVGDMDNDGYPDLFLTRLDHYTLYRNRGDGTFEDVTRAWNLDGPRDWPTSSAFADIDDDGDLDLYVCHYLAWDPRNPRTCRDPNTNAYTYCDVRLFPATHDRLFRNDGDRFVEVTDDAGIVDEDGRGLGVLAADLNRDSHIDFYVANDTTANFYFRNQGDGTFVEDGHLAGLAGDAGGGYQAGMGIAAGDLNHDGWLDLAVTNFLGESTTYYQNLGDDLFADRSQATGLYAASRNRLGFGVAFLDYDHDTHLDYMSVNGHVQEIQDDGYPRRMPMQLLAGSSSLRWTDVSRGLDSPLATPRVGRGLVLGDLDRDGRLDALVLSYDRPLADLRNRTPSAHMVNFLLEGTTSNRDAVGALVRIEAGHLVRHAQRVSGGSYQSTMSPELHFGLGTNERIDRIEIQWPSGTIDRIERLPADATYRIVEGSGRAERLHDHPLIEDPPSPK